MKDEQKKLKNEGLVTWGPYRDAARPRRPLWGIMGKKAQILLWVYKNGCMYYATSIITECWHGHIGGLINTTAIWCRNHKF